MVCLCCDFNTSGLRIRLPGWSCQVLQGGRRSDEGDSRYGSVIVVLSTGIDFERISHVCLHTTYRFPVLLVRDPRYASVCAQTWAGGSAESVEIVQRKATCRLFPLVGNERVLVTVACLCTKTCLTEGERAVRSTLWSDEIPALWSGSNLRSREISHILALFSQHAQASAVLRGALASRSSVSQIRDNQNFEFFRFRALNLHRVASTYAKSEKRGAISRDVL